MMKQTILGGLLTAALLFSQTTPRERLRQRHGERLDSLAKVLNLSETQRQQIAEIERAQAEALRGGGRELLETRRALRSAQSDAEIDELTAKQAQAMARLNAARLKTRAKIRAVLTPEQTEKFDALGRMRPRAGRGFSGSKRSGPV